MKVIKHGTTLEFECTGCGCKYVAGENETRDCGFYVEAECPECGTTNRPKAREENEAAELETGTEDGNA